MSYFDGYVADGLCCEACGEFIDEQELGHIRRCEGCAEPQQAVEPSEASHD